MPYEKLTKMPRPRSQTINSPKAFPLTETREPRGAKRFGPKPQPERATRRNVNNVDRHGTARPWQEK